MFIQLILILLHLLEFSILFPLIQPGLFPVPSDLYRIIVASGSFSAFCFKDSVASFYLEFMQLYLNSAKSHLEQMKQDEESPKTISNKVSGQISSQFFSLDGISCTLSEIII